MPKARRTFLCQQCGRENPRWEGRCPECGQWNTYVEVAVAAKASPDAKRGLGGATAACELSELVISAHLRLRTPFGELDRVLGGGIVPGSLVLLGGEPGIGKSTLLLQAMAGLARDGGVLYASGEESGQQVKLRGHRLGLDGAGMFFQAETNVENILEEAERLSPRIMAVDSIQSIALSGLASAAGTLAQVRECGLRLMQWAKARGCPVILTSHVTKEGVIAGPHVLEHMVDVVLYLEGERFSAYRILRGIKNRFGSTNEIGVFQMGERGMAEVANPSEAFLAGRSAAPGSAIVPTLEGTRPLLVEVQALTTPTAFGQPRRVANGLDFNRLLLVAAVLTKRAGLALGQQDILASVVGGLAVSEPAADLGLALALASSLRDVPVREGLVAVGEVGLGGELRVVSQLERRLGEAARLGFKACLIPKVEPLPASDLELFPATTLSQALRLGLG